MGRLIPQLKRLPLWQPSRRFLSASAARPLALRPTVLPSGIDMRDGGQGPPMNAKRSFLPNIWLRDCCRCQACVNQDTLQRNFKTFALPKDLAAVTAEVRGNALKVEWNDGHHSAYPMDFVSFYLSNDARKPDSPDKILWGAEIGQGQECDFEADGVDVGSLPSGQANRAPAVSYGYVMDEAGSGIGRLTKYIRKFGFVFVTGTPPTPEATEKLLEKIAFIRVTHYGGFYDFTPDLAWADTAYTNVALPAHTDTTYFTDPAGLQSFHMLEHKPPPGAKAGEKIGGESLLVDGFQVASTLRKEDPEAFEILTKVRLPWHASGNKGINIAPDMRYPVLEMSPISGELHRVRWNNDDRGIVPFDGGYSPEKWYEAAGKWGFHLEEKGH